MSYHRLYEGKYLDPFKTDNPALIGIFKELRKSFDAVDGKDTELAKEILEKVLSYRRDFVRCYFCGESNIGHSEACPAISGSIEEWLEREKEWESGVRMGLRNGNVYSRNLYNASFMLGYGRGLSERQKTLGPDSLFSCSFGGPSDHPSCEDAKGL